MAPHHLTQAEYAFISGFFQVSFGWITRNRDILETLSEKGGENLLYYTAHPSVRPEPNQMLLGIFLMCVGKVTEHFNDIVELEKEITSTQAVSPEDAKAQVQSLLTKIRLEL